MRWEEEEEEMEKNRMATLRRHLLLFFFLRGTPHRLPIWTGPAQASLGVGIQHPIFFY
jgi:hypothetical protein